MIALPRLLVPAALALSLGACDIVAAPIHATADVVGFVPVVGPLVAAPVEVTADVID